MALHPAAMLTLWAGVAVFIQALSPPVVWFAAVGLAALAGWIDLARTLKLIRRIRVLLIVIILMFGFATPGTAVLPTWTVANPTWDGLSLGATQAARLLAMVSLVAVLLARMPIARLVLALHVLAQGLRPLGVSPDRVAVRLSLVLAELDGPKLQWRRWLDTVEAPGGGNLLALERIALRWPDYSAMLGVVMAGVGVLWWRM
ncbi:MAG: hypothetical protein DWQ11_18070 [Proteobacteria bacterium]|nr:MAG: hypothetical protein DWQ11_18070 [Pseudomonadota bacterium]